MKVEQDGRTALTVDRFGFVQHPRSAIRSRVMPLIAPLLRPIEREIRPAERSGLMMTRKLRCEEEKFDVPPA